MLEQRTAERALPPDGQRRRIFLDRYALKGPDGEVLESEYEETIARVARAIASVEPAKSRVLWEERFAWAMSGLRFIPGGRVLAGAGSGHNVTYFNCYVLDSPEDSREGILDNLKAMVEIMARGGGVGINLSSLRPKGSYVRSVNGTASGPCNWANLYSVATGDVIQQGGSRRGALLLMLDDDHPDVEEFVTVKRDHPGQLQYANLSVGVSDRFMAAVRDDADWQLVWNGEVRKSIRARALWRLICEAAWASGEPGIVFIERYDALSNTGYYERIISVNPCGEVGLPAFGCCNLGYLNLPTFLREDESSGWRERIDWSLLREHVRIAVRFLDNVIDASAPIDSLPQIQEVTRKSRRLGLGTMGLADLLIRLKIRYGSDESLVLIDELFGFIRDAAYAASVELARERGSFPAFSPAFLERPFVKALPDDLQAEIARDGIRNAVLLAQAPTGTTSLLAGVSSGIEPVFDFAMRRTDRTGEHVMYHPLYEAWWKARGVDELHAEGIVTDPDYFVAAGELTSEEHVRVQAKIQEYLDQSVSKTCNAPNSHAVEDVDRLYSLAYELGCKGITYFRDGSREGVLESLRKPEPAPELRVRPSVLTGQTFRVATPVGTAFVTLNADEAEPFEVFITVGKAGSDVAADAEALGRMISLALRLPSALPPSRRVAEIAGQLAGIGGNSATGFGPRRVRSLADAVSQALGIYLRTASEPSEPSEKGEREAEKPTTRRGLTGDYCPGCGQLALVNEEGCRKCYACGFAAC